jgi:hypothetical protein
VRSAASSTSRVSIPAGESLRPSASATRCAIH